MICQHLYKSSSELRLRSIFSFVMKSLVVIAVFASISCARNIEEVMPLEPAPYLDGVTYKDGYVNIPEDEAARMFYWMYTTDEKLIPESIRLETVINWTLRILGIVLSIFMSFMFLLVRNTRKDIAEIRNMIENAKGVHVKLVHCNDCNARMNLQSLELKEQDRRITRMETFLQDHVKYKLPEEVLKK